MTTTIAGMLKIADSDRTLVETVGQTVVYNAMQEILARHRASLQQAQGLFVARQTSNYSINYRMHGGGYLQKLGRLSRAEALKVTGEYTVQFPLEGWGDAFAISDIDLAYMTVSDLDRVFTTVQQRDINTRRQQIMTALFRNTVRVFTDEIRGDLNVQPLANGDAVLYPPVLGADDAATEDHYLASGYTVANISTTNDPVETLVEELIEHFGESVGGENICIFGDKTLTDKIAATITDYVAVEDSFIRSGNDTDIPVNLPSVPGKIVGRVKGKAWIVQWRRMPANYAYAAHLEVEAPLYERVDLPETGLSSGLQLVAQEERYPILTSQWRDRFGYGVANRRNGVAMHFTAGSYTIPTF